MVLPRRRDARAARAAGAGPWTAWAVLLVPAAAACAHEGPAATWQVQALASSYEAEERIGTLSFNRERGRLKGVAVGAQARALGLAWSAYATREEGTVAYDGLTQFGLPLLTETRVTVDRWQAWTRYTAPARGDQPGFSLGLGLGTLRLARAIRPGALSLATTETMHVTQAGVLGEVQGVLPGASGGAEKTSSAGRWHLRATWQQPLRQRLDVQTFGVLDPYVLSPRRRELLGLEIGAATRWVGPWKASLHFDVRRWRFGESDAVPISQGGVPAGLSRYPGSTQWVRGFGLSLGHPL